MSVSATTRRISNQLGDFVVGHSANAERVQSGIREFLATGRLQGRPVLIVHGRSDDRVPVTFSSPPYIGLNSHMDGDRSQPRYVEVTNAEHFGTDLPGFDTRMIPLTPYPRALDPMWEHLTAGAPLPESQVVHTTYRGGEPGHAPDLAQANVPLIPLHPRSKDPISVRAGRVTVPD